MLGLMKLAPSVQDYVEQSAREECIRRLFFLSGPAILSSPDWFLERSFEVAVSACCVSLCTWGLFEDAIPWL